LAFDAACYAYVPAAAGAPRPGADVRIQLNDAGTTQLARYLGPRVVAVDGLLASPPTDAEMVVAPVSVQIADGARQRWTGDGNVLFPRQYVTDVQIRTIDRRKSTIAAVAIAASVVTVGTVVMRAGSSTAPTTTGAGTGVFSRR
jgi:hypothetical protein